jgi:hypothetical protein
MKRKRTASHQLRFNALNMGVEIPEYLTRMVRRLVPVTARFSPGEPPETDGAFRVWQR